MYLHTCDFDETKNSSRHGVNSTRMYDKFFSILIRARNKTRTIAVVWERLHTHKRGIFASRIVLSRLVHPIPFLFSFFFSKVFRVYMYYHHRATFILKLFQFWPSDQIIFYRNEHQTHIYANTRPAVACASLHESYSRA